MTPAVFVHGFLGGSRQWDGQVSALNGTPVIALDLPGFGAQAGEPALPGIGDYADWVIETLDDRGIEKCHLIGHSMGGMIAQEAVARAPDKVDRLVLYGTGATGVLPGRFETICASKERAQTDGPEATARRISATWFLDGGAAAGYEACAAIAEATSLNAMLTGLDAMKDWDGTEALGDIRSRTLVLWGDHDRTYPWQQTQHLWQSIPSASLSVIPMTAHAAHLEKPSLFNMVLSDFLDD